MQHFSYINFVIFQLLYASFNPNQCVFFLQQNISIALVGKNEKFHILNDEETARFVAAVEKRSGPPPDNGGGGGSNEPATIDDFDTHDPQDPKNPRDSGDPQVQVAMET